MPIHPTYPGVYIQEIPSGVRTVTEVATSIAAFIGTFRKGLLNEAVQILSAADFEREYGGLERNSEASYAIQQFFLNGGTEAWVIRVGNDGSIGGGATAIAPAQVTLNNKVTGVGVVGVVNVRAGRRIRGHSALNPGSWGNYLRIEVGHNSARNDTTFNSTITEVSVDGDRTTVVQTETFNNLTMEPNTANNAIEVVNHGSRLVQLDRDSLPALTSPAEVPAPSGTIGGDLPLSIPATGIENLTATLTVTSPAAATVGPVTLQALIGIAPTSYAQWAQLLQSAIRNAAADPAVTAQYRAYFAEATVDLVGDGSATNPRRFVVLAGRGARPYDPAATLTLEDTGGTGTDAANYGMAPPTSVGPQQFLLTGGEDGTVLDATTHDFVVPTNAFRGTLASKHGLYALEDVDLFNILCIPDAPRLGDNNARSLYAEAETYVEGRRAMLIVDIPENIRLIDQMQTWRSDNESLRHPNAAVYFPRTLIPDPRNQNRQRSVAASGTIAGLWARTDTQRGVWKAPAGTDAQLRNVSTLAYVMTDLENGTLNPLGVNCLRSFPVYSNICWGARTLEGADVLASDWKYVPVRRLTLFLEESLYRGTKWVVFEPNDEPLWAQIRLNVGAFMQDMFRKGAFQGTSARQAFFVKCDHETTTQQDINNGIVNIEVGFAPLKPAEFVILKIQQIAPPAV
jgi:phage tail sheath protein FI